MHMKLGDWIVGGLMFLSGTVIYLSNYKRTDKVGKVRSRVGWGLMFAGALLSVGQWAFYLALSGH